jgi:hypothetical protein
LEGKKKWIFRQSSGPKPLRKGVTGVMRLLSAAVGKAVTIPIDGRDPAAAWEPNSRDVVHSVPAPMLTARTDQGVWLKRVFTERS